MEKKNNKKIMKRNILLSIFCGAILVPVCALAMTDNTYNITIDNVGFAGGEPIDDGTYQLMDTIGEPIVGVGSSANFSTQAGFWFMLNTTLSLVLDSATEDLGTVVPGVPNTGSTIVTVTTDAPGGYDLLISQNHDMLHTGDSSTTIAAYAGTIASPTTWTNTGLGFTITDGTSVDAKWGTNPNFNYAGIPGVDTIFHEKVGYTSGGDDTTIGYQIDVPPSQKTGTYTNTVTYTAVSKL
ncbi:MAG: hypothetical protein CR972_00430 [Candidatus Moraniibacteriota bacterium]|nr:MAG: hypothetical protein CR972_00430 [Candidatus Moranbacteria bacterium]